MTHARIPADRPAPGLLAWAGELLAAVAIIAGGVVLAGLATLLSPAPQPRGFHPGETTMFTIDIDGRKHASVNFDPKLATIPSSQEWGEDAHGLRAGLLAAEKVFAVPAVSLKRFIDPRSENGDRNRENLMAVLEHAAEGFGEFKRLCLAAEGRVLAAREAVMSD